MSLASRFRPPVSAEEEESLAKFSIRDLLTKNLAKPEVVDRKGRISPSSGCAQCPRQAFLTGVQPNYSDWDATSETYAKIGNTLEDLVFRGLGNWAIAQNIRLWENTELQLGAAADILVKDFDNKLILLEVKTCSELPKEPKQYQFWQMILYMAYYKVDCSLVYYSRSVMDGKHNLLISQFDTPYDIQLAKEAMVNSYISRKAIDNKKLPPKGTRITKQSDCGFCNFGSICWRGADVEFEAMTTIEYIDLLSEALDYWDVFESCDNVIMRREDMWNKIKENGNHKIADFNEFNSMFRISC